MVCQAAFCPYEQEHTLKARELAEATFTFGRKQQARSLS